MSSTGPVGSAVGSQGSQSAMDSWIRSNGAVFVDRRDTLTVIGSDGVVRAFADGSAALVRLVLDIFVAPHSRAQLLERVREVDAAIENEVLVDVVDLLVAAGALVNAAAAATAQRASAVEPRGRVVLGVSGAVAAVDVPALARLLIARGFEVAVMMTESARKFVTPESLAAITHRPVLSSFWTEDPAQPAPHIRLSTWADLVVVYPASAATLARIATGATEDLVAATVVATRAPVILAPSMNDAMYRAPSVQRNLELLREDGFYVVQPRFGVEVATAPHARTAMFGAAHAANELAQVVELVWASAAPKRVEAVDKWERQYAATALENQPWFTDALDDDVAAALTRAAKHGARRLLDLGTGPGTTAIFAAQQGFEVVATDVSATALQLAKRRAQSLPIAWLLDDISASRLWGQFDVVVDRGCLHALPRAQWPQYAAEVARRVVTGGQLILKQHATEEGTRWGTQPLDVADLEPLFGAEFTIVETAESRFAGVAEVPPRALFARLVRR